MARNFNSSDDVVIYNSDTALNITGAVSITGWVYLNALSLFHCILAKERTTTRDMPYELRFTNDTSGRMVFIRAGSNASWTQQTCATGISANAWHHCAVTCSAGVGSVTVKFYIDGALVDTKSLAGQVQVTTTTNPARIGNRQSALSVNCRLAHTCLYNKELTLNEVLHDRAHGRFDCPNLVLYAPLWGAPDSNILTSDNVSIDGTNFLTVAAVNYLSGLAGAQGQKSFTSSLAATNSTMIWALRPDSSGNLITLRGTGAVSKSSSASSIAPAKPAGTQNTDILVCFVGVNGSGKTITPPAGWTTVSRSDNGVSGATTAIYRALGSVASTTFTLTAGTSVVAFISGFVNVDNTIPSDVSAGASGSSTNNLTFGSIITVTDKAMVVGLGVQNGAGAATFTNLWPHEPDLSGTRRIGNTMGADIIGGPPFIGAYGGFPLQTGLWAAVSGGAGNAWTWTGAETQGQGDSLLRFAGLMISETQGQTDTVPRAIVRTALEAQSQDDTVTRAGTLFARSLADSQGQADSVNRFIGWTGLDTQSQTDIILRAIVCLLAESQSQTDTVIAIKNGGSTFYQWTGAETQSQSDNLNRFAGWAGLQTQAQVDILLRAIGLTLAETQSTSDTVARAITRALLENQIIADVIARAIIRTLSETQGGTDTITSVITGSVVAELIELLGGKEEAASYIKDVVIGAAANLVGVSVESAAEPETVEVK